MARLVGISLAEVSSVKLQGNENFFTCPGGNQKISRSFLLDELTSGQRPSFIS